MTITRRLRSALFTPATSPERAVKLAAFGADAGIIDLEDAVPPEKKAAARAAVRSIVAEISASSPSFALFVRVNPIASEWFASDVEEALSDALVGVIMPKVASASDLLAGRAALDSRGLSGLDIVAGLETGRGVLEARAVVESGACTAVYFGAEDYVADIGGVRTTDGLEVLYARSHVALAASVFGVLSLDEIVADYKDETHFVEDATFGRSLGYTGKLCIHPRQVALANAVFTPSAGEIDEARRVVDAYEAARKLGVGAIGLDGSMVDVPMVRRAQAVLDAANTGD